MPGESGVTVGTNSRVFYTTREAAGASGARHSLHPLIFRGWDFPAKLARMRGEIAKLCLRIKLFENCMRSRVARMSEREIRGRPHDRSRMSLRSSGLPCLLERGVATSTAVAATPPP